MDNPPAELVAPSACPTATPNWVEHVTHLAKGKEGLLIAAAVPFALGYGTVVWNAYRNNLGFIPPLQVQCVMAGIVPTGILVAAGAIMRFYLTAENKFVSSYYKANEQLQRKMRWLITFLFLPAFGIIWLDQVSIFGPPSLERLVALTVLFSVMASFSLYLKTDEDIALAFRRRMRSKYGIEDMTSNPAVQKRYIALSKIDDVIHKFANGLGITPFLPVMQLFILALGFWLNYAYPRIPQEFGGMQPRLAYLAVSRAQLSPEMRHAVLTATVEKLPVDPSKDPLAVVQTKQLDVVYENNDAMMVRVHDATLSTGSQPLTVYQIKKSSIQGISWCGFDHK